MLSRERNERLTRVGRGTPLGELLRRYWYPVAFAHELEAWPLKRVRLLGEDLVLYRDGSGNIGLLEEHCPHRRASLFYGAVEEVGIRCGYHGWLFDHTGRCLEQPAEPKETTFRERVTTPAYKVQELGGMLWAYLGPEPAPLLPRYDVFVMEGLRDVGHCTLPVNFMQIMENAVDPTHVEWLHGRYFRFLQERTGAKAGRTFQGRHVKIAFDVFEHGIIKRRLLEGQSEEDDDWKIGHPLVFPYMMRVGGGGAHQMQIRVPVDDETTWFILYTCHDPGGVELPPHGPLVTYEVPWRDEKGNHIVDFIEGQDIMAWVTQGRIADRTREHLGKSDTGVALLRRLFFENMEKVARGEDPLGVIRDPARNTRIDLPCERNKFGAGDDFILEWIEGGFARYSPQKDEILALYRRAQAARRVEVGA